ncbi:MAG: hypothetical protein NTU49_04495, partial [Gammaproteobacteria bacterium]|nr:hypothetical protein [Gammaproteobacteria bacterium]
MRNNDLRLLSGKLLSEIPESHKFCRALLHCYYNTDPIDPNEDNLEVDTIRAATIFKNLLLNKESFPIEKSSVIIILQ